MPEPERLNDPARRRRSWRDIAGAIRTWWAGRDSRLARLRDVRNLQADTARREKRLHTAIKMHADLLHNRSKQVDAQLAKQKALLKKVDDQQKAILDLLGQGGIGGRLREVEDDTKELQRAAHALLRASYLDARDLPMPQALLAKRFGILSQNEEDGIVLALFDRVGTTTRRFVSLGSGTNGGSTGMLALDCGWSGLMVDASDARIARVRDRFRQSPVVAHASWITRENVNDLLRQHGFTGEIDLLDIDVDGIDYWLWEAIEAVSPRVVVAEYNGSFGFERAVTVPYDAQFDRHRSGERRYYGASLRALERLGARRGYRLVTLEPRGINSFFVRHDVGIDLPTLALATHSPRPDWAVSTHVTKKSGAVAPARESLQPEAAETVYEACARLGLPLVEV